ncbi:MAG: DUF1285 domain-containing protein [Rhodobiaceae bacterium]|nr:DUF1285 domain-containing protein [Rhodobiaceae bacterium]MCC0053429.1 DUF1285 domain-containing protein [Rhodobiaceae bacterium]
MAPSHAKRSPAALDGTPGALDQLIAQAKLAGGRGAAPVHLWNPDYCGEIDMRIAADGTWFYMGTPIGRKPLVKLFASVLRRDPERFVLVTPVERIGIAVDDAPFVAVEMVVEGEGRGQTIAFRTNVDDVVEVGAEHPLRFETDPVTGGLKPYVLVRGGLEALVNRAVFYDLVALGVENRGAEGAFFGVWSAGAFFAMAPMGEIAGLR